MKLDAPARKDPTLDFLSANPYMRLFYYGRIEKGHVIESLYIYSNQPWHVTRYILSAIWTSLTKFKCEHNWVIPARSVIGL